MLTSHTPNTYCRRWKLHSLLDQTYLTFRLMKYRLREASCNSDRCETNAGSESETIAWEAKCDSREAERGREWGGRWKYSSVIMYVQRRRREGDSCSVLRARCRSATIKVCNDYNIRSTINALTFSRKTYPVHAHMQSNILGSLWVCTTLQVACSQSI